MTTRSQRAFVLALTLSVVLAAPRLVRADGVDGVISVAEMDAMRAKATQQKADAQAVVKSRGKTLGYSQSEVTSALSPAMVRKGSFVVTLKGPGVDGVKVEFPWYRIGFARNPISTEVKPGSHFETNKGGVRLHKGVFADEVYALALKMDSKLAITRDAVQGHAFRGAKGGIGAGRVLSVPSTVKGVKVGDYIDPAAKSVNRAEVMRAFGRSYQKSGGAVGPGLDIQAGDVNTKAPEMKVLSETYGSKSRPSAGVSGKATITGRNGKLSPRGGIDYRSTSTGDGVWMTAVLAAKRAKININGATVVAQGWGEVGRAFGESAMRDGARVIAVQELYKINGKLKGGMLELPKSMQNNDGAVRQFVKEINEVVGKRLDLASYKGGKLLRYFSERDASHIRADIVGCNAMGNVLNHETVPRYITSGTHQNGRKVIVEGANLAETSRGAKALDAARGKLLAVPGDLSNLGGVHVSNLEAVQNAYGEVVTSPTAKKSLKKTIEAGWKKAMEIADKHGVTEREAVELAAIDGMMRRALDKQGAPKVNIEGNVISAKRRRQMPHGTIKSWVGKAIHLSRIQVRSVAARPRTALARMAFGLSSARGRASRGLRIKARLRLARRKFKGLFKGWGKSSKTSQTRTKRAARGKRFSGRRLFDRVMRSRRVRSRSHR